jgi:glycosyltransferase involved in cell wall biosynthesis
MISGAAIIAEKLAQAMAERGHQVLVIAASDHGQPYLVQNGNLSLHRLHSYQNPVRVCQRFLLYPRHASLRALQDFIPDIIHTHEPLQMGLLGIEYARRVDIPVTLTIHQLPWFVASYLPNMIGIRAFAESALWAYARMILRQFTSVTTPSHTVSKLVASMTGVQPMTISNGISLETFHPPLSADDETDMRKKLNLPLHVPIILHLGRLDTDKHVERVILAAVQAMHQTEAHLLIVGDGCEKPVLQKMCKTLGIADRTHFPGYVSLQEGLPEIYRLASLFVTASEIETQSIVLLEAIASGLPIVAVRASSIPEIVYDGVNGYLAEPGDIHTLSKAIRGLLVNPVKAKLMGTASHALAVRHKFQYTIDEYEGIYRQLTTQTQARQITNKSGLRIEWERVKEWMKS